jgi:hypothetical protein
VKFAQSPLPFSMKRIDAFRLLDDVADSCWRVSRSLLCPRGAHVNQQISGAPGMAAMVLQIRLGPHEYVKTTRRNPGREIIAIKTATGHPCIRI